MKKTLTLTFILLLVMAAALMATDTRVYTMGDNNNILLDDANIWLYPSRTYEYPNIAVAEFGSGYVMPDKALSPYDFYRFGAHWKLGSDQPMVLGTYFSNSPTIYPTDLMGDNLVDFNNGLSNNNRIDLFFGRQMSDYNFGAHLNIVHSSSDLTGDSTVTYPYKEGFGMYTLSLGLTPTTGKWDIAGNIGIGSWTQENRTGVKLSEPDGFMDLSVMGRYFAQQGPNYTLIPHAAFGYSKRGAKYNDNTGTLQETDKYTTTGFELGCGWNYTPATNVLAVMDFGIQYYKWKGEMTPAGGTASEASDTYTTIPYFKIGLDADVFKWMDIRMGATSYWDREKWVPAPSLERKYNYPYNDTYLGFGFHWNRLHVDTYTDPGLFLNGFNFISGRDSGQMNLQISALYEMM
jgi:hypothetical protein